MSVTDVPLHIIPSLLTVPEVSAKVMVGMNETVTCTVEVTKETPLHPLVDSTWQKYHLVPGVTVEMFPAARILVGVLVVVFVAAPTAVAPATVLLFVVL